MAAPLAGGSIAVLVLVGVGAVAGETGGSDEWDELVAGARAEMRAHDFSGVMVVEWDDGTATRQARIRVRHADGVMHIEAADGALVAAGDRRMITDGREWSTLAGGSTSGRLALASAKYDVERRRGPLVAGRRTTIHEAGRDGVVVERVYVDDDSGLVLRRERVDEHGTVVRAVAFETVRLDRGQSPPTTAVATAAPVAADDFGEPLRDPDEVGDGFRLLGRWRHDDGTGQLYYSDGVLGVSVFEQRGRLAWDALPDGHDAAVEGASARRYSLPVGEVLVFERNGVVYTCVGDVPRDELVTLAADVSARDAGTWEKVTDTVLGPFRW